MPLKSRKKEFLESMCRLLPFCEWWNFSVSLFQNALERTWNAGTIHWETVNHYKFLKARKRKNKVRRFNVNDVDTTCSWNILKSQDGVSTLQAICPPSVVPCGLKNLYDYQDGNEQPGLFFKTWILISCEGSPATRWALSRVFLVPVWVLDKWGGLHWCEIYTESNMQIKIISHQIGQAPDGGWWPTVVTTNS